MSDSPRRSDIQGLRAVAVLMVVSFHAGLPVPGGFAGVDVFFVISGFVVTSMLHREWASKGRISFGYFYLRRFKRLVPALSLMLSVILIANLLLLSPQAGQQIASATAVGAIFLTANFVIARNSGGYFDPPAETNPFLNTWSLSVEEQFYLVVPALLAVGWIIAARGRRILVTAPAVIIGLLAVLSFGLAILGSSGNLSFGQSVLLGFYSPFTRAWEFAAGVLLSMSMGRLPAPNRVLSIGLGVLGTALLCTSLLVLNGSTPFPSLWTVVPVSGALLILFVGGSGPPGPITSLLSARPMVKIGDWSYSIYLWHWPLIVFALLLWPGNAKASFIAAMLSFVPAVLSYKWLEQPMRDLTLKRHRQIPVLIVAVIGTPLILAAAIYFGAQSGYWSSRIATVQSAHQLHLSSTAGCRGFFGDEMPSECIFNGRSHGTPIYLLGDSNADQFIEAALGAAVALDRPLYLTHGCRFIEIETANPASDTGWNQACRDSVTATLSWLKEQRPGLVIIANSDHYWTDNHGFPGYSGWSAGPTYSELTTDPAEKINFFGDALKKTVRRLQAFGNGVLLVQTIPHFEEPNHLFHPESCSVLTILADRCWSTQPLEAVEALQKPVRTTITNVAKATGAHVLDLRSSFCDSASCSTRIDGKYLYFDGHHISVAASHSLTDEFLTAIKMGQ